MIIQRVVESEVSGSARSFDASATEPTVRIDVCFGLSGGRDEPDALRDRFSVARQEIPDPEAMESAKVNSRLVEKRQALRRDEGKTFGTKWVTVDERQVSAPSLTQVQARQVAEALLKLEQSFGRQ